MSVHLKKQLHFPWLPSILHTHPIIHALLHFLTIVKKGFRKISSSCIVKSEFLSNIPNFYWAILCTYVRPWPEEPNLKGISELKPQKTWHTFWYLRKDICQSIIFLAFFNVLWFSFHGRNWLRFRSYFLCSKHHFATKLGLHLPKWRFRNMHVSHHHQIL